MLNMRQEYLAADTFYAKHLRQVSVTMRHHVQF